MIRKITSIGNLGIFRGFDWDKEVKDESGKVRDFQAINIIYGRNYSGKTTLSRIPRAMETGKLSEKFENPSFNLDLSDGVQVGQTSLTSHGKSIRVFNEDFVRENLRFITDPNDSIESFAILGDDNNKIEREIETLQAELGSKETGAETGLYAKRAVKANALDTANREYNDTKGSLESQLGYKATGREIGIKYKPERFGDQNYNIQKLKADIKTVQSENYEPASDEQVTQYERLISEKTLGSISPLHPPKINFQTLATKVELLVTKRISESDKIEELVKDAVLNRWVNEGRTHHKNKRKICTFCANTISEDRWIVLEKHFDEESEQLEKDIDSLITSVDKEMNIAISALSIKKNQFYSKFHGQLDELDKILKDAVGNYGRSLDSLTNQLKSRKEDIINQRFFDKPKDYSEDLVTAWSSYEAIRFESDAFSKYLSTEQASAKESLRLKEVSDYLITIQYEQKLTSIEDLKKGLDEVTSHKSSIDDEIFQKESLIESKKRELNDEEKGAKKVNEYLNNFFGHQFLMLEARNSNTDGENSKRIRFEVTRDGNKAYHLSEGECSLLAFCYFLAKLDDIDTRNSKPIIWIDDPISSLDGNHIFFVYSLIYSEIVSAGKFEQLFISTHNLDFLKYLKKLKGFYASENGKPKDYQKSYFVVFRKDMNSTISVMPKYLKDYVTEFNFLFHQIHKCASIESIDDSNYTTFYNFSNNARKFLEIYLYYKYPDQGMNDETLNLFFGEESVPAILTDRINNEYSHLSGIFERGSTPVEVPEMQTSARLILERLKQDSDQYSALLRSVGEADNVEE